jgi:hypothetical protein
MHPKLWRLLVSVSLRLFCGATVPATEHAPLGLWLAVLAIAALVPAPGRGRGSPDTSR